MLVSKPGLRYFSSLNRGVLLSLPVLPPFLSECIHFNGHYVLSDFPLIPCPDLPSDPRLLALFATHRLQPDIP